MADLQISATPTPNPNSAKFTVNRTVNEGDPQTFTNAEEAAASPLAKAILAIEGVTMVFLLNNFITVSKSPDASWNDIVPQVETAIRQTLGA